MDWASVSLRNLPALFGTEQLVDFLLLQSRVQMTIAESHTPVSTAHLVSPFTKSTCSINSTPLPNHDYHSWLLLLAYISMNMFHVDTYTHGEITLRGYLPWVFLSLLVGPLSQIIISFIFILLFYLCVGGWKSKITLPGSVCFSTMGIVRMRLR